MSNLPYCRDGPSRLGAEDDDDGGPSHLARGHHDEAIVAQDAPREDGRGTAASLSTCRRHYPLDLPGLCFERYEHRRLDPRELLVHRIMSDVMTNVTPYVYKRVTDLGDVDDGNGTRSLKHLPISAHNLRLQLQTSDLPLTELQYLYKLWHTSGDNALLRRMVFLLSPELSSRKSTLRAPIDKLRNKSNQVIQGSWPSPEMWSGEDVDLVQRHYLEVDDCATRQWLRSLRVPMGPFNSSRPEQAPSSTSNNVTAGPSTTVLPSAIPKRGARARALSSYQARFKQSQAFDDQIWTEYDKKRLAALRSFTNTQDTLALYDGGASSPLVRQALDFCRTITSREIGVVGRPDVTPLWPQFEPALKRLKLKVSWHHRRKLEDPLFVNNHPVFEPARGRGPHRYYNERCHPVDIPGAADTAIGRSRSLSEPPRGMFAHARLPRPAQHGGQLDMEITYPRLSLSQLDKRSRRRSLSRSHIADMFSSEPVSFDACGKAQGNFTKPEPREARLYAQPKKGAVLYGPAILDNGKWCDACHCHHPLRDRPRFKAAPGPVKSLACGTSSEDDDLADAQADATDEDEPAHPQAKQLSGSLLAMFDDRGRDDGLTSIVSSAMRADIFLDMFNTLMTRLDGTPPQPGAEAGKKRPPLQCSNCLSHSHATASCRLRCGHCGAPSAELKKQFKPARRSLAPRPAGVHLTPHHASECKVQPSSRCRCVEFPTFHRAEDCPITCSRPCGNPHRPGHFRHRNAMTCAFRCCMCGMHGHAGKDCRFTAKSCLCGGKHLGQDCTWNPGCHVEGCVRYHCRKHCRRCGVAATGRDLFANRLCRACTDVAVSPARPGEN